MAALYTYNATQHVLDSVAAPYLNEAVYTFLMTTSGARGPNQGFSLPLMAFLRKVSELPFLPADVTVVLVKKGLSAYCFIYFVLCLLCVMYWANRDLFTQPLVSLEKQQSTARAAATARVKKGAASTAAAAGAVASSGPAEQLTKSSIAPFASATEVTPPATTTAPTTAATASNGDYSRMTSAQVEELSRSDSDFQNMSAFQSKVEPSIRSGLN